MIRIRFQNSVYVVKEIHGFPYLNKIIFWIGDNKYIINFKDLTKVEELLTQACEHGFIDLSKEDIEYEID